MSVNNREWLNTLTDEELADWIYASQTKQYDPKTNQTKAYAPYSPCLNEVVSGWNSARGRLIEWLREERE